MVRPNVTKKKGVVKKKPIPLWLKRTKCAQRRLQRLRQRVRNLCKVQGMPPMALVHLGKGGSIHLVGHESLVQALKKSEDLVTAVKSCNPVSVPEEVAVTKQEEKIVDLRKVSLTVDFTGVSKVTVLRDALSQIVIKKGSGSRSVWGREDLRPEWWLTNVPFVSPSSVYEDDKGKHRNLKKEMLAKLLMSWRAFCIDKLKSGYKYIDAADDAIRISQLIGKGTENVEENCKEKKESECKTEEEEENQKVSTSQITCCDLANAVDKKDHLLAKQAMESDLTCLYHLNVVMLDDVSSVFHMQYVPDCTPSTRRLHNIPPGYTACGPGVPFWECVFQLPFNVVARCYAYATLHLDHYAEQFIQYKETAESVGERMNVAAHPEECIQDILLRSARQLLETPSDPGPGGIMFLAGMLNRDTFLHTAHKVLSSFPCPCSVSNDEPIHFYMDEAERSYHLILSELIQDELPRLRQKKTTEEKKEPKIEHCQVLPRRKTVASEDKRLMVYKKLEVFESDKNNLVKGRWICDHIVDTSLLMFRDVIDAPVHLCLATYGAMLLGFTATLNMTKLQREMKGGFASTSVTLIPLSTGVHWILLAIFREAREVFILCSLGMSYQTVARNVKRVVEAKEKEIGGQNIEYRISYPKVPRQTNGIDCGVFVVKFGHSIMRMWKKTRSIPLWEKLVDPVAVEQHGRGQILEFLQKHA